MKNILFITIVLIMFCSSCTKNNQNSPPTFSYLNVNQTYTANTNGVNQNYDIDNDGQVDWGFTYETGCWGTDTCIRLRPNNSNQYSNYVVDSVEAPIKILPVSFNINSALIYGHISEANSIFYKRSHPTPNDFLAGSGDFYIGFKSQNPTLTNSFYGWAKLYISADGLTLIVKDMAMNKVNGGSINVGQH